VGKHSYKQHVIYLWLEECLETGQLLPVEYYDRPLPPAERLAALQGVVTGVSGRPGAANLDLQNQYNSIIYR